MGRALRPGATPRPPLALLHPGRFCLPDSQPARATVARALPAALLALAFAACNYSFNNPAQSLEPGQVSGRATAGGAPLAGASISLRGSDFDQVSRATGRFSYLPLPAGTHVFLLRQGLSRALSLEVDLGFGSDGQPEGVNLGDQDLPLASTLAVSLLAISGGADSGVVVDEATGMAVLGYSSFQLEGIPVGAHRILAATRDTTSGDVWVAGPAPVTVATSEQGTVKTLAPLQLRAATADTGDIHFRVSSLVDGLAAADASVTIVSATGAAVTPVPGPDSNGDRDVQVAEGAYFVEVDPPPAYAATVPSPARRAAVILGGDEFDLGTFYLVDQGTITAAQLVCTGDADCAPGGTCTEGICIAYTPPAAAPASLPYCNDLPYCATPGSACDAPGDVTPSSCVLDPVSTLGVCVPCSSACTPDGTIVVSAAACS